MHKSKGVFKIYDIEDLRQAVAAMKVGSLSYKQAVTRFNFNVPRSTRMDKVLFLLFYYVFFLCLEIF